MSAAYREQGRANAAENARYRAAGAARRRAEAQAAAEELEAIRGEQALLKAACAERMARRRETRS